MNGQVAYLADDLAAWLVQSGITTIAQAVAAAGFIVLAMVTAVYMIARST